MQVPVLVVRRRRLLCGEAGEEEGVGQVEGGRVDPKVLGDSSADLEKQLLPIQLNLKTRTGYVQKVCGGVWQGFDHLTKLESSKVEVVLQ